MFEFEYIQDLAVFYDISYRRIAVIMWHADKIEKYVL